jgi:uncharacterized membrane protein YeaQ/YmgE (transglycosylase-associated protein family)
VLKGVVSTPCRDDDIDARPDFGIVGNPRSWVRARVGWRNKMGIVSWIVLGAIAGYLAGFLVKGDEGLGVIGHIVLGIVGALVGGFLARVLLNTNPIDGALDISSIVAAVIGAIIVVWAVGMFTGRRSRGTI